MSMKLDIMSNATTMDDAALVAEVLNGNRDAFGQLVARHQSAVCGLAYSACGNISQSEDLAQEAFVIAWRKLGELENPAKFKSWLYGIARNLVKNSFRRQTRNPLTASEPLDESLSATTPASNPTDQAISKEEEAILWRSLEQIPETYREPLVLFYRENQSIDQVAAILEVSEEAARQRLSRGRKLLQERVIAFVEGALGQTGPGPAFTLGVLAVLPAMAFSAKAATVSAAAKGGAIAKASASLGWFGAILTPVLPLIGMFLDYRIRKKAGLSDRILRPLKAYYIIIAVSVVVVFLLACFLMEHGPALVKTSPALFVAPMLLLIIGYPLLIWSFSRRLVGAMKQAALEPSAIETLGKGMGSVWEYRSRFELLGLPLMHIRFGARIGHPQWKAARGWIAISDGFAFGSFFAYGGLAVAPVTIGACAIGLFSYGGMAIGGLVWGGFAFGVWAFGALAAGWQAFSGGCAIAWKLAWGYEYAIAHDYALGAGTVHAAQANTPFVEDLVNSSWGHDFAMALAPYFYWLMWAWAIPMTIIMITNLIRLARSQKISTKTNSSHEQH